jgi:hypothetical protein
LTNEINAQYLNGRISEFVNGADPI